MPVQKLNSVQGGQVHYTDATVAALNGLKRSSAL